jgi:hypothetical protein
MRRVMGIRDCLPVFEYSTRCSWWPGTDYCNAGQGVSAAARPPRMLAHN